MNRLLLITRLLLVATAVGAEEEDCRWLPADAPITCAEVQERVAAAGETAGDWWEHEGKGHAADAAAIAEETARAAGDVAGKAKDWLKGGGAERAAEAAGSFFGGLRDAFRKGMEGEDD